MKLYNEHTFEKLGFHVIRERLSSFCLSASARDEARSLVPQVNPKWLVSELDRVAELVHLFRFGDPFPLNQLEDMNRVLAKARVEGAWLPAEDFHSLAGWLDTIEAVRAYLKKKQEDAPRLFHLIHREELDTSLAKAIKAVIDERGNVRDNASPKLINIRQEQASSAKELRKSLQKTLRYAKENNWSEAADLTIRNDRLVIAVKADAKGRVPGFVHDISSSGNTVFVEPTEALGLNNRLRELQLEERNEIIRILQSLTSQLSGQIIELQGFCKIMTKLDVIRAKAKLAIELNAHKPVFSAHGKNIKLIDARYPLLVLKSKETKSAVVPLNMELNNEQRILIISGPNAGGKSVSLKTVGLLQLMVQSGLLIPADPKSEFRIFKQLFMDIGDEQSVESDLSTYTSHLYQLRLMGDHLSEDGLFLVDEFGSGTDPQLGGAIAEAFLERFLKKNGYGVITTHYGNVKDFAARHDGIANAAMAFDMEELAPTYRLETGLPGRSYAFEIAQRVGVHPSILKRARRKMGRKQLSAEDLLRQLETKSQEMERLVQEEKAKDARLARLLEKNERLQKELSSNKKRLMLEAKIEAKNLIKDANKKIEATIREIRESQADKERTKQLRKELAAMAPKVEEDAESQTPSRAQAKASKRKAKIADVVLDGTPAVGDWAKLKNAQTKGELVEIQGNRGVLVSGGLRLTVKLKDLERIKAPKQNIDTGGVRLKVSKKSGARIDLDVMGQRAEEALVNVQRHVDAALMGGLPMVRILHGKGSGVLRDAIRGYLRDIPQAKSVNNAPIEMGGDGWTLVSFE